MSSSLWKQKESSLQERSLKSGHLLWGSISMETESSLQERGLKLGGLLWDIFISVETETNQLTVKKSKVRRSLMRWNSSPWKEESSWQQRGVKKRHGPSDRRPTIRSVTAVWKADIQRGQLKRGTNSQLFNPFAAREFVLLMQSLQRRVWQRDPAIPKRSFCSALGLLSVHEKSEDQVVLSRLTSRYETHHQGHMMS